MEIMKEILRIVTSKSDSAKIFPELDPDSPEEITGSLQAQLINGLLTDELSSDLEASKILYQTEHPDARYRTLKSRLYERLLHSLLFLQVKQPEHSEYLSYYYKCTRNLICSQTLMRFASRKAGYAVALKTFSIAQKYQFTDICLTLSALLRDTVAFWQQHRKFEHYNNLVRKYIKTLEAEYESDAMLDSYSLEFAKSSRTKVFIQEFSYKVLESQRELQKRFQSHVLTLNLFRARINNAVVRDELDEIVKTSDDAIRYLTQNPHLSQPARLGEFRLRKMSMLLVLRRQQEAYEMADQVIGSFSTGGNNWYIALDLAVMAALSVGDYRTGCLYHERAMGNRKFALLDEIRREQWLVYGAYLFLAERIGLFDGSEEATKYKQFRLSTFLNSIPEEVKSKKDSNVLVLISHVYFLVVDHDLDAAERRIDYLRVYVSRYLKERTYHRVRIFLRMLQALPRFSFDAERIAEGNADLYAALKETSNDPIQHGTSELIPFEVLYEALLKFLRKQAS